MNGAIRCGGRITFQVIWAVSMIVGCVVAFESEPESGTRAK